MNKPTHTILAIVVLVLGIGLMIAGVVSGKHGATVIGMITAAVTTQRLIATRK